MKQCGKKFPVSADNTLIVGKPETDHSDHWQWVDWSTDYPLDGLEKFTTIIAINLNDLPNNQPARKILRHHAEICEF